MNEVNTTTSPLRNGHIVKEAATSLLSSRQVVYDVWLMRNLKDNRRIAKCDTLAEAHKAITPEHRTEYVYILKWTPAPTLDVAPVFMDRFGPLQGQSGAPKPTPECEHGWGCLCGREHTKDMRDQVRNILRSN